MKFLFAVMMIAASLTASAQHRTEGRIVLRDGHSTVRININERSDTQLRIRLLEEAVRDLQAQVYDLRDVTPTRIVVMHVCTMNTAFSGSFVGKASTKIEAEAKVRNNCMRANAALCSYNEVKCQAVEEIVQM